jgi:hypothetical protein
MESDFRKYAEGLAEHARDGVAIEEKILEWKQAERKLRHEENKSSTAHAKAS